MFYGNASDQEDEKITRNILLPQPVVTDKFKLIVDNGPDSVVFKMDVIGMPPDKKYEVDPILTPQLFEEGNCFNFIIILASLKLSLFNIEYIFDSLVF